MSKNLFSVDSGRNLLHSTFLSTLYMYIVFDLGKRYRCGKIENHTRVGSTLMRRWKRRLITLRNMVRCSNDPAVLRYYLTCPVISDLDRSPPRGDAPARRATSPIHSDSRPAKSQYPREQMVVTRFFTRDTVFFEGPPQAERLEPGPILDANTSTALTHCLHMALKLLEESTGHRAFIETAKDIVSARREDAMKTNKPEVGIYANKSVDEMPTWVRKFLKQIREKGIPICVSEGIEDRYGFTQKWSWGSDMEDWDSATAAVVYINKGVRCSSPNLYPSLLSLTLI